MDVHGSLRVEDVDSYSINESLRRLCCLANRTQRQPGLRGRPNLTTSWHYAVVFLCSPSTISMYAEESLKRHMSKLVLAPWLFLIVMLAANFTAALTSKLTVAQLQPSAAGIETLRRNGATIGCNTRSFTCQYLVDVLHIKRKNVREIRLMDDYPGAFQRGEIKGAVFVTEHANIFLAKYCRGFTLVGPTFTFGGLGFAFQKGSPLTADMSRAILRVIESGKLGNMEKDMLSRYNCSSADTTNNDTSSLGFRPFSGLFYITGGIATIAFLMTIIPQMKKMLSVMVELLFRKGVSDETCPENEDSKVSNQGQAASG